MSAETLRKNCYNFRFLPVFLTRRPGIYPGELFYENQTYSDLNRFIESLLLINFLNFRSQRTEKDDSFLKDLLKDM